MTKIDKLETQTLKFTAQAQGELEAMGGILENERKEMGKVKKAIKSQVSAEVEKIKGLDVDTRFEFQRINS